MMCEHFELFKAILEILTFYILGSSQISKNALNKTPSNYLLNIFYASYVKIGAFLLPKKLITEKKYHCLNNVFFAVLRI